MAARAKTLLLIGALLLSLGGWFIATSRAPSAEAHSLVYLHVSTNSPNAISGSWLASCAIVTNGSTNNVKCWGDNVVHEIGNKTTASCPDDTPTDPCSKMPAYVCAPYDPPSNTSPPTSVCSATNDRLDGVVSLGQGSAGVNACAIRTVTGTIDRGVYCWGQNNSGQLGNTGNTSETCGAAPGVSCSTRPLRVTCHPAGNGQCGSDGFLSGIVGVVLGYDHSCARDADSYTWCWGKNYWGQLGNGSTSTTAQNYATRVCATGTGETCSGGSFLTGVSEVSAGVGMSCARLGGSVKCWGQNQHGELGIGSADGSTHSYPLDVSGLSNASTISTGGNQGYYPSQTCAVISTTTGVKCWGQNKFGQLGNGQVVGGPCPNTIYCTAPVDVCAVGGCASGTLTGVSSVSALGQHTCIVKSTSGDVDCWGFNNYAQTGINSLTPGIVTTPMAVCAFVNNCTGHLTNVVALSGGYGHTCALQQDSDGFGYRALCWGWDKAAQIGINQTCCDFQQTEYIMPEPYTVFNGQ